MSKRVLCKFFAHGACLKGEHCDFSHDWKDQANNICTFYQKGVCSYGSRCRYDHVKVTRHQPSVPSSSSNAHPRVALSSNQIVHPTEVVTVNEQTTRRASGHGKAAWTPQSNEVHAFQDSEDRHRPASLADQPICSFAAAGSCPHGENCAHIHGDLCAICGKQCLHPYRPDEREEHIRLCTKNNMRLEALRLSQDIECCVCLERVLLKPTSAERKFGLLSECDHPFCISCIRNWRSNSPASGMDVNAALRACPICRKLSYFVIPSVIWYSSKEEKQEIVDNYKAKLQSIDCKYFDFGNGTCPFGTSCFYKHKYKPHLNRPRPRRPRTYQPRMNRHRGVGIEEEELSDLVRLAMIEEGLREFGSHLDLDEVIDEEELPDFARLVMDEDGLVDLARLVMAEDGLLDPSDLDDDDVHNLSEMFLFMQLGLSNQDSLSDDDEI
ncbi:E3 ubiquitin-protein ligase makorin protein [Dioscorea alata]|uniref:E3 ubiquitin-protein ligase makorin protein n=1 Tax=Dioscorea alata TaxID=55571 RepID=A0ACB7VJG2_DIOAL|nr:E3 ubiquitin-protein ligase makorin protein [Dioscorea alata]